MKINVITIDGPSASGKGALALGIANIFGFKILDSGSLYRLFAYFLKMKLSSNEIADQIKMNIEFNKSNEKLIILHEGKDITSELRSEEIAKLASEYGSKKTVRDSLYSIQRNFYDGNILVADGRDMGTVVFKDAKLKIFLTASPEERAKRRYIELQNRGQEVNMPALLADIKERDLKDSSREISPLIPAEDSHLIDSSNMSLKEVCSIAKNLIKKEFI